MGAQRAVGIDLGTTHTVVAWADSATEAPRIFEVPQLVNPEETEAQPLLPSFLYAPPESEAVADPFGDAPWVVGSYARRRGYEVPGRLVNSAKSWLSHSAVDRLAKILPWSAEGENESPKLSPVEASQRILAHVRRTWDLAFPGHPLHEQTIVLTVPASFDEVARELTVLAAERAGLEVRLLEEPQAAFYDFLSRAGTETIAELFRDKDEPALVLVCDVGGGTTDLTLISARQKGEGATELERIAVGRHLLLGGDNIDLALAHLCEPRLIAAPARLEPSRFHQLVLACRLAKEKLLAEEPPESVPIVIASAGSALVGGTASTTLTRSEVERVVFEGFLPEVRRDTEPTRGRAGLLAFGLPYEPDPAITRHVARFFARNAQQRAPDALLLNGGLFRAQRAAERVARIVGSWGDRKLRLLPQPDPDLSVARGAVVYAQVLAGRGLRIGGGTPHGFYVAVDAGGRRRGLCVLPRGAREGERGSAQLPGLTLRVGQPVRFELFAGESSELHAPGTLVELDDERFFSLPRVTTQFPASSAGGLRELPVALEGELSAVGTVELACVESAPPPGHEPRRFRLSFELRAEDDLRSTEPPLSHGTRRSTPAPEPRLVESETAISRVFGKSRADVRPREIKDLLRELERLLGERRSWTAETNRRLGDAVLAGHAGRKRSDDHERVFWLLSGYCLRPGIGHPKDAERVQQMVELYGQGLAFPQPTRGWQQFWIAFRRISPGLDSSAQEMIRDSLDPFLAPAEAKLKKPKNFKPQAADEMLELASWLERVPRERRAELGRWLLELTWTRRDPRLWAAIGRLGARVPSYASAHHVIAPSIVERWLEHLLRERWGEMSSAPRAALELARVTGDRARDLAEPIRQEVARRLEAADAPPEWALSVREFVPLAQAEQKERLGEELPVGLSLSEFE